MPQRRRLPVHDLRGGGDAAAELRADQLHAEADAEEGHAAEQQAQELARPAGVGGPLRIPGPRTQDDQVELAGIELLRLDPPAVDAARLAAGEAAELVHQVPGEGVLM